MNIIFWGTPDFCVPVFNEIHKSNHNILAVVTQPDRRRARGKKLCPSPIKEIAVRENIPVFTPINIKQEKEMQEKLNSYKADLYIVIAFGQILPKSVLEQPLYGCWNIHASLLPKLRGAAPIQWALINGDKKTGIGFMLMEEGLDTGPILLEKTIKIDLLDNSETLSKRLSLESASLTMEALKLIKRKNLRLNINNKTDILSEQKKKGLGPTYARQINKTDYIIDWRSNGLTIYRKVAGLYPNAYTIFGEKRLKIYECFPLIKEFEEHLDNNILNILHDCYIEEYSPGDIIEGYTNKGILVASKDCLVLITKAKLEGKGLNEGNSLINQITGMSTIKRLE